MNHPTVTMYVADWCPYCQRAKHLLSTKRVAVEEINVDGDTRSRQEMIERSHRRTVPQIFIGERHIGGCDDLFALEASGELARLLTGAP